jgi:hypothetical protein
MPRPIRLPLNVTFATMSPTTHSCMLVLCGLSLAVTALAARSAHGVPLPNPVGPIPA